MGVPGVSPVARLAAAAAVEMTWVTAHVATYPLGLLRRNEGGPNLTTFSTSGIPLTQRSFLVSNVVAATTPVVLVHGIVDNPRIFSVLQRNLRRRGIGGVRSFSYGPLTSDIRGTAARLGAFIEDVCTELQTPQVHVVGHSLGGLLARYETRRPAQRHRPDGGAARPRPDRPPRPGRDQYRGPWRRPYLAPRPPARRPCDLHRTRRHGASRRPQVNRPGFVPAHRIR